MVIDLVVKSLVGFHKHLMELTGGKIGGRLGPQKILLLNHAGRRSGRTYTTPLSYYRDGDRYLVVASNWGKENHPQWFLNLMARPRTTIQLKGESVEVEASQARDDEYERLWSLVTGQNRSYITYQDGLGRRIPIVILEGIE